MLEDLNRYGSAKIFHLSYINSANIEAAKLVRANEVKVVIDADNCNEAIAENIRLIDVFIGSEFFYKAMFSDEDYEKTAEV